MHRNFWTCDRSATSEERALLDSTFPAVRLANLMQLSHNASVDLYCEAVIAEAQLVVVRVLRAKSCWPYGVDQIVETCAGIGATLVLLPGDDQPSPERAAYSTRAAHSGTRAASRARKSSGSSRQSVVSSRNERPSRCTTKPSLFAVSGVTDSTGVPIAPDALRCATRSSYAGG